MVFVLLYIGLCAWRACGDDRIELEREEFVGDLWHALALSLGMAALEYQILALDIPALAQAFQQQSHVGSGQF
jgi:hypothetical protein